MVMSGIEEVSTRQSGHKHQSERKREGVSSPFTPAKGSCPNVEFARNENLKLTCLELGEDALHRARQSQKRGDCLQHLVEELLRCQSQTLQVNPQEFAGVGCCAINEVKIGRQPCRNDHQRADSPAQEGILHRDLE